MGYYNIFGSKRQIKVSRLTKLQVKLHQSVGKTDSDLC